MKCNAKEFAELYKNIYKDLYKFAVCIMKDPHDAEDVVSEAVIQAYSNIGKLRDDSAFKSWMFRILYNICKKKLKNDQKRKTVAFESFFGEGDVAAPEQDYGLSIDVWKAFSILSEEEQVIVGLSVFGGYKSSEIGQLLHMNENTTRSKRSRALAKMSVVLEESY